MLRWYDYTGRNTYAAAWFAQAFSDGHGGSVRNAAAGQAVHKSVLEHCGAQDGGEEGQGRSKLQDKRN